MALRESVGGHGAVGLWGAGVARKGGGCGVDYVGAGPQGLGHMGTWARGPCAQDK